MVQADLEQQKKPLIKKSTKMEVKSAEVEEILRLDDDLELRKLISRASRKVVLSPTPKTAANPQTALHLAVNKKAEKCLRLLLDPTPDVLDHTDVEGQTPLMLAVSKAHVPQAIILLDAGADPNTRDDKGESPLHKLVYIMDIGVPTNQNQLLQLADKLISKGADLEAHSDLTPLALAAIEMPNSTPSDLLAYCKKLIEHGASMDARAHKGSVREVLLGKGVDLGGWRVGNSPPRRPVQSECLDLIFANKSGLEVESFLKKLSRDEQIAAVQSRIGKNTVLVKAVEYQNETLVEILLKYGADPRIEDMNGELALHKAGVSGNVQIFNELIKTMKDDNGIAKLQDYTVSLMRKLLQNWNDRKIGSKIGPRHKRCFERLLESDVELDLNQESGGTTCLNIACAFNNQEAVSQLLIKGAYLGVQPEILPGNKEPLILNSLQPQTLTEAMNGCISHLPRTNEDNGEDRGLIEEKDFNNPYHTLVLDYRFLLPPRNAAKGSQGSEDKGNEVSMLMEINCNKYLRKVLTHPLVQTLLYVKWRKVQPLFLVNLMLYFIFVVFLTLYVYTLKDLRVLQTAEALNATTDKTTPSLPSADTIAVTNPSSTDNPPTVETLDAIRSREKYTYILIAILVPLTLYMMVREAFQIWFSKTQYFKNIENYLQVFVIIASCILCFASFDLNSTIHLSAWAMLFAWYEFVLILGRAPPLTLYITMLRETSWNFLKFILLFGSLILAFTISFNIILQGNENFEHFFSTLPKAIVMATGEFEYSEINVKGDTISNISGILIILVFIFLIFLVLMNVMNGLAVTDTKDIMDHAILHSITSRLELIYQFESLNRIISRFIPASSRLIEKTQVLCSNNSQWVLVKINRSKKDHRFWYGNLGQNINMVQKYNDETKLHSTKLDTNTTNVLRTHRLNYLQSLKEESESEEKQRQSETILSLHILLQKIAEKNPGILKV